MQYFGTDGIRGFVGQFPMTPDFIMKLGWAAGKVLGAEGTQEILIGKDTRASGYMIESALESGLSAAGVNIALAGPLPTPAVAYLTSTFRADAGVVISASHNPYYDNGIKFFSNEGSKLSDAQQKAIEKMLQHALEHGIECVASEHLGKARRIEDAAGRYIEYCKRSFPSHLQLTGLKIVVDSANGAAYKIAAKVYRELGAQVISIHDQPNGININAQCGATSLSSLVEAVKNHQADIGLAVDGDADRIMLVDHTGAVVDGDEILWILARDAQRKGYEGGVVGTLMANFGLELALQSLKIPFVRANVGDRYVMEQLSKTGWRIGGEGSGHILLLDYAQTGDAIVASLRVLALMVEQQASLAVLKQGMQKLPQVLINVKYQDTGINPLDTRPMRERLVSIENRLGQNGRVLLRKSGTEPLIRVMVEATCRETAQDCAEALVEMLV
ncbi:phosphoglucosamine mutase [Nitrincola alkalisediminis]|uniref:phosphoglucosamine mutase n=1 Tax=Nitrincola alkalisediminis TaxID=1366656 RepID=UPI001876251D|nr:phosphoglucosamine mutase [Nitrincola alkalisediminis]